MPLVTRTSSQSTVYAQATAPTITQDGETWVDTDTGAVFTSENGSWVAQSVGAIGTARQQLAVNSGATALEYVASLQSLMTAQADLVYASAANTPVRLAKGTAAQVLKMNAGATAPEWGALSSPLELIESYDFDGIVTTKQFTQDWAEATYSSFLVIFGGGSGAITMVYDGKATAYYSETSENGVIATSRVNATDVYLMGNDNTRQGTMTLWISAQNYGCGHMIGQRNGGANTITTGFGQANTMATAGVITEMTFNFAVAPNSTANITLYGIKRV